jgi:hypothetical protein
MYSVELGTTRSNIIPRAAALGLTCLAAFGANMPSAQATTLVAAPGTPESYRAELQGYINQSAMPTPKEEIIISREGCGEGEAGARSSCINYIRETGQVANIKLRPDLNKADRSYYIKHELGFATDLSQTRREVARTGQPVDYVLAVTSYRADLMLVSGKAKTYDQAKHLIQEGPQYSADGQAVLGRRYWAGEYVAQLYAECATKPKVKPNQKVDLEFYGTRTPLQAKYYNASCAFIKLYLAADRKHFETARH